MCMAKKGIKVETKEHIGYVQCINGKSYDIFQYGENYGFYSKSREPKHAGEFQVGHSIDSVLSSIERGNGSYEYFIF